VEAALRRMVETRTKEVTENIVDGMIVIGDRRERVWIRISVKIDLRR